METLNIGWIKRANSMSKNTQNGGKAYLSVTLANAETLLTKAFFA